jgi:hypothetical protein
VKKIQSQEEIERYFSPGFRSTEIMGHGKSVPLLCVDFVRSLRLQSVNLDEV